MKTVLVIEDNPQISQALSVRLSASGFNILTTDNVADATDMALNEKPSLVILDIFLPGGEGFDVARLMRLNPESMSTPIIFITASKNKSFVSKAKEYEAFDFFEKPYCSDKLVSSVMTAIRMQS